MAIPSDAATLQQLKVQDGIHILHPHKDSPVETSIDIIAVHGLMGTSFGTWTDPKTGQMWLRDFLPTDLPTARISTFGYDAAIFGRSVLKLGDVANNLLAAVRSIREEKDVGKPLIFVGHSMGGLVIKQALLTAQVSDSDLFNAIKGIVFMAVPHRGSRSAYYGSVVADMVKVARPVQPQFLRALEADNDSLTDLSFQFGHLLTKYGLQVVSVLEGKKTKMPHFWRGSILIVPKHSAQLGIGSNEQIFSISGGDHRNMCKFSSSTDPQYRQLSQAMRRLVKGALDPKKAEGIGQEVLQEASSPSADLRAECMESLDAYDAIMVKDHVATPVADTLAWLVQDSKFTQWLNAENAQFLWIHGEPGCGKSVMSAYVVDHLQRFQAESVVCHFFCSRLSEIQNNTRVLLQGILHQLFVQRPDLIEHALERKKTVKDFANKPRLLWETLLQSIQDPRSGQVILVVDGLDECDSEQTLDFLKQLLAKFLSTNLKVLMTSRTDLQIESLLTKTATDCGLSGGTTNISIIDLCQQQYSKKLAHDIETFIKAKVSEICETCGLDNIKGDKIRSQTSKKAGKSFLWVSLVLQLLCDSATMSAASIDAILNKLPRNLRQTYHTILTQVSEEDRPMARKMFKIIAAACRPLSLAELTVAFAVEPGRGSEAQLAEHYEPRIERTVFHLCRQLVTVKDNRVEFVHSTAKDFLRMQVGVQGAWYAFEAGESELTMSKICNTYLLMSDFQDKPLLIEDFIHGQAEQSLVEEYCSSYPFLNYAALHWPEHHRLCGSVDDDPGFGEQAMRISNVATKTFKTWFAVYCASQPRTFGYPKGLSTCHLAALNGHSDIIAQLCEKNFDLRLGDDLGWSPLLWACYGGDVDVVHKLMQAGAPVIHESTPKRPGMLETAAGRGHFEVVLALLQPMQERVAAGEAIPSSTIVLAVEAAAQHGHATIVRFLLDFGWPSSAIEETSGAENQNEKKKENMELMRALRKAAKSGNLDSVLALLHTGVDIKQDPRLVEAAVTSRNLNLVRTLVEAGAMVNAPAGPGPGHDFTPLQSAVDLADLAMVRYLLEAGANVNAPPAFHAGMTALQAAVTSGSLEVVNELIQHGARVGDPPAPWMGVTAMQAAARNGHLDIARRLEEVGADVDEPAPWRGATALQWAAQSGHLEFVKWLLQFDVDLEAEDETPHFRSTAWQLAKEHPDVREVLRAAGASCKEKHEGFDYMYDEDGNRKPEFDR